METLYSMLVKNFGFMFVVVSDTTSNLDQGEIKDTEYLGSQAVDRISGIRFRILSSRKHRLSERKIYKDYHYFETTTTELTTTTEPATTEPTTTEPTTTEPTTTEPTTTEPTTTEPTTSTTEPTTEPTTTEPTTTGPTTTEPTTTGPTTTKTGPTTTTMKTTTTTTTPVSTTSASTTNKVSTTTTMPPSTTPCSSLGNRTGVALDDECGQRGIKGYCTTVNAACMPRSDGSDWRCRCTPGFLEKSSTCVPVPKMMFSSRAKETTIEKSVPVGHTVLNITLTEIQDFCTQNPRFQIATIGKVPFTVTGSCKMAEIKVAENLPENKDEISFMLFMEVEVKNGVFLNDGMFINIKIPQRSLQADSVIAIPDGTFAGFVIMTLNPNYYSLGDELSVDNDFFKVDKLGQISTTRDLYLKNIQDDITLAYSLKFNVFKEETSSPGSKTKIFSLTVVIVRNTFTVDVTEGTNTDNKIGRVYMPNVNYIISSEDIPSTIFTINQSRLTVDETKLDYDEGERRREFTIKTSLTDIPNKVLSTRVIVNVLDGNDNPPRFIENAYTFSISSTNYKDVIVGAISATDVDTNTTFEYSVDSQSYFAVDESGIIRTRQATKNIPFTKATAESFYAGNYSLLVHVTDGRASVSQYITIYLVQETQRTFDYKFDNSVYENTTAGSVVGNVSVKGYRDFQFAATERASNFFKLDRKTGLVRLQKELDREGEPGDRVAFSVLALTEDGDACSLTLLGELIVNVLDVNDNAPKFENGDNYTTSVWENQDGTVLKLNVPIETTDVDINDTIRYSLSGGFGQFSINPITAIIMTTSGLDRETKERYELLVEASDGVHRSRTFVIVSVLDVNDNPPDFGITAFSTTAIEPQNEGRDIITVTATDKDIGENAHIVYSIEGGDGKFLINPKNGTVRINEDLDRERSSSHTLKVYALNQEKSATAKVTIVVVDINDNPPVFVEESLSIKVNEKTCYGNMFLMKVRSTDKDIGKNGLVHYSIKDQTSQFSVNETTGDITCKNNLVFDFESTRKIYSIQILAEDLGVPSLSATTEVSIIIQDENDNAPVISPISNITLKRNELETEKPIAVIYATDKDSGMNAELTYKVYSDIGLTINDTVIFGSDQGSNVGTYNVTVVVTDKGSPDKSSTSLFYVEIITDTTTGVSFGGKDVAFEIKENNMVSATVGRVSDLVESNGATLKYRLEQKSEYFELNVQSGEITSLVKLDREERKEHLLIVRAYDGSNDKNNDLALVRITVTDTNDNTPEFQFDSSVQMYIISVSENKPESFELKHIIANDKDDDGSNANLVFSVLSGLDGNCHQLFRFRDNTGHLIIAQKLDYETYTICKFKIQVTDGVHTENTSVDVNVLDYNDNKPTFSIENVKVKEDIQKHQWVTGGYVDDRDSRENADIMLTIEQTSDCPFRVEARRDNQRTSIALSVTQALDYETRTKYSCKVTATDKGSPPMSSTAVFTILVEDINDNDPEIDESLINSPLEVSRDADQHHVILKNITVTDKDTNTHIVFRIDEESDDYFGIDPSTGALTVEGELKYLQKDKVLITIYADDSGVPPRVTSVQVEVRIKDDNIRPWFKDNLHSITIKEETLVTGVIFSETALDEKDRKTIPCNCSYRLEVENPSDQYTLNKFEIDTVTADIRLKSGETLDREGAEGDRFTLLVSATDHAPVPKRSDPPLRLYITVEDINDQLPLFRQDYSSESFEVLQMAPLNTTIGSVTAFDKDKEDNAIAVYSIVDLVYSPNGRDFSENVTKFDKDVLAINKESGVIFTNGSLNRNETKDFYLKVKIVASDKMKPGLNHHVWITVRVLYDDPNKHTPVFTKQKYEGTLGRNDKVSKTVVIVTATDNDTVAPNNLIVYSISSGNIRHLFDINKDTGEIMLAYTVDGTITAEIITLNVTATDKGIIPRNSMCEVEITITGDIDRCLLESTVKQEKEKIVADRDLFMIVMIVLIVALCFFMLLAMVYIYKFKTATKQPDRRANYFKDDIGKDYEGLDQSTTYPSTSSDYTAFTKMHEDDGYADADAVRRSEIQSTFGTSVNKEPSTTDYGTGNQSFINRGFDSS